MIRSNGGFKNSIQFFNPLQKFLTVQVNFLLLHHKNDWQ